MSKDSIFKTFLVAFLTCAVCGTFVAATAVLLKPYQLENQELFKNKNILMAAGLMKQGEKVSKTEVAERFGKLRVVKYDFTTGEIVAEGAEALKYDERLAAKAGPDSVKIGATPYKTGLSTRGRFGTAYIYSGTDESGKKTQTVVIPIVGKGLWSLMSGLISLTGDDLNEVHSLLFYEHGETAGLGGEIENPLWAGKWTGKTAYDASGKPAVRVVKGPARDPHDKFEVDGISGSTLTCNGVNGTVWYWLAEYRPLVEKLLAEGGNK